ncbi:helix-turn-helix domain-containing protein [Streptomyces sp. NPDC055103]
MASIQPPSLPLRGEARHSYSAQLAKVYESEQLSIRALAAMTHTSYGLVHRLLSEAKVRFRGRGGNHRTQLVDL